MNKITKVRLLSKIARFFGFRIHSTNDVRRMGRNYTFFPPLYNRLHHKYFEVFISDFEALHHPLKP